MVRALIARALSDEGYEVARPQRRRADRPGAAGFPDLPMLHIDDISRRRSVQNLPNDVPTVYKAFSVTTLREAVRKLLAG
jgi:hypothetical protein